MAWWGARKGRTLMRPAPGPRRPAAENTWVTSRASSCSSGGSRPGRRLASMVLPAPGGPVRSRLWAPAAAISRARRVGRRAGTVQVAPADQPLADLAERGGPGHRQVGDEGGLDQVGLGDDQEPGARPAG